MERHRLQIGERVQLGAILRPAVKPPVAANGEARAFRARLNLAAGEGLRAIADHAEPDLHVHFRAEAIEGLGAGRRLGDVRKTGARPERNRHLLQRAAERIQLFFGHRAGAIRKLQSHSRAHKPSAIGCHRAPNGIRVVVAFPMHRFEEPRADHLACVLRERRSFDRARAVKRNDVVNCRVERCLRAAPAPRIARFRFRGSGAFAIA